MWRLAGAHSPHWFKLVDLSLWGVWLWPRRTKPVVITEGFALYEVWFMKRGVVFGPICTSLFPKSVVLTWQSMWRARQGERIQTLRIKLMFKIHISSNPIFDFLWT